MGIDVVVTCTKRKRYIPDPTLFFEKFIYDDVQVLSQQWMKATNPISQKYAAADLYMGAGWHLACKAFKSATKLSETDSAPCRFFILSAGYGLLNSDDYIPSYEATFATGSNQIGRSIVSTVPTVERHQAWWSAINQQRYGVPTPIADTMRPNNYCLTVASQDYIDAIIPDLTQMTKSYNTDHLAIVSIGTNISQMPDSLQPYFLPIDVRIEHLLKVPRTTINQAAAFWLLDQVIPNTGWSRRKLEPAIREAIEQASVHAPKREPGQRMTDEKILDWIREEYRNPVRSTVGQLLQTLRRKGWSCEQSRFSRLYRTVTETAGPTVAIHSLETDAEQVVLNL